MRPPRGSVPRRSAGCLALVVLGSLAWSAVAAGGVAGRVGPRLSLTGNGRHLTPAGRLTTVGDFPTGAALTPDGRFLWAVDSGHGRDDVQVVDVRTGRVRQVLPLPGAYGGVAFARDGRTAYVSGEPVGNSHPAGKVTAPAGDAIHVFRVDRRSGRAVETTPITIPPTSGGDAQQDGGNPASLVYRAPGPGPSSGLGWPIGLAVTPDGRRLVVALNQADQADVVDLATRTHHLVKVGRYPFGVVADRSTAWVSNELDGTVSKVDLATLSVTATVDVGGAEAHPEGMALDGDGVYVAVTDRDQVVRVDKHRDAVTRRFSVGRAPAVGTAPVALVPWRGRIYVADAGEDALAVIDLRRQRLVGRIPTAAYPTAVAVTPRGQIVWTAAKGLGAGPNPAYGEHFAHSEAAPYGSYDPDMLLGRVGVLPVPDARALGRYTRQAEAQVRPADLAPLRRNSVLQGPGGTPSQQIKHVFYVVRENRTYDQIFGRDPRGDGDPRLELFGDNGTPGPSGGITPNAHALSRRFPLLDHVYADSEVSVDGHLVTSGGYAIDFVQRALHANYADRGRIANFGQAPVTLPPNGFLFDQAVRQGVAFKNYGEMSAGVLPAANDGRPTYARSAAGFDAGYPLFFGCDNAGLAPPPNSANHAVSCSTDSGTLATGANVRSSRFDYYQRQFQQQVASGTVPALTYLTLPNDHTNGVRKDYPTPSALVADNDLGLGQLVDLISHSSIWSSSAIFVVEDDTQDGGDHVDAHRMPSFVISPWARTGAVVHTRYDQLSVLRTVESILGLRPLSLFDGLAEPMDDAFRPSDQQPDLRPYDAVTPTHPLDEVSTATPRGIDGALPWSRVDLVPQRLADAALWRSVYGSRAVPPPPGPHASAQEEARAAAAVAAWRHRRDLSAALLAGRSAGGGRRGGVDGDGR